MRVGQDNEELLKVAREVLEETVLAAVFKRIADKKIYESKRRTWNKIRKSEKVKELEEKRRKWAYMEPKVSVRDKLLDIFKDYSKDNDNKDHEMTEKVDHAPIRNQDSYNVPLSLALNQCVFSVVLQQHALINKCLIHLTFRKLRLMTHLDALRSIYLFEAGDVLQSLMTGLLNDDLQSTFRDHSLAFLNVQLEEAARSRGGPAILEGFEFQIINK